MAIVGDILLVLLAVLGVLIALVVSMPIAASARGALDDDGATLEARLSWAFGLVSVGYVRGEGGRVRVLGLPLARVGGRPRDPERARRQREERARRRAARQAKRGDKPSRGALWWWWHRYTLLAALERALAALHLRGHIGGVVGLADPDETAFVAFAIDRIAARLPEGVIDVGVDFTDDVVLLEGHARLWVWPPQALWVLLAVRYGKDMRRALRAA